MSILIQGMEMPKNCTVCKICCGLPYQHRDVKGRRPDCPLIEVETVDQEELIMPLNMIGGYLRKVTT